MTKLKKILIITFALLILVTILQNSNTVSVQFLIWHFAMPGVFFYPLLVISGFLAGWIGCLIYLKSRKSGERPMEEKYSED